MKNFRDYCNQSMHSLTIDENEKEQILANCLSAKQSRKFSFRNCLVAAVACVLLFGFVCIHLIPQKNSTRIVDGTTVVTCSDGALSFPNEISTVSSESKLITPEGNKCDWSYEQVCDYLGMDLQLPYVPADLTSLDLSRKYQVYVNAAKEVTYDNIEVCYSEGGNRNDGASLDVVMSKGKLPVTDVEYTGTYNSYIHKTKIKLCKINTSVYQMEFLYQGIGYRIMSNQISYEELVKLLKAIITE